MGATNRAAPMTDDEGDDLEPIDLTYELGNTPAEQAARDAHRRSDRRAAVAVVLVAFAIAVFQASRAPAEHLHHPPGARLISQCDTRRPGLRHWTAGGLAIATYADRLCHPTSIGAQLGP
jgi:hypothetical protein